MANGSKKKVKHKQDREWRMVSLVFTGKHLDPEKFFDVLHITPDNSCKRGDSYGKNKKRIVGCFSIKGGPPTWRIETQIKSILKKISPVKHEFKKLIHKDKTIKQSYLKIVVDPCDGDANPVYFFNSKLLNEFTSLGIDIVLSIYIKSEWEKMGLLEKR